MDRFIRQKAEKNTEPPLTNILDVSYYVSVNSGHRYVLPKNLDGVGFSYKYHQCDEHVKHDSCN